MYLPSDLMTSDTRNSRRLKVTEISSEIELSRSGHVFVGSSTRTGIPVDDTYTTVVKAGSKWLWVKYVEVNPIFSDVTDGTFLIRLDAYVQGSSGNSWSYTPSNPLPLGRSTNAHFVNVFPESRIDLGVSATYSGLADYPLFFEKFYVDQSGNRNTLQSTSGNFFESGGILIPPGGEMLVVTETAGDAIGSADLRTVFFSAEIDVENVGVQF